MHFALPGSALVHAAVLGAGLLMFAWPEPEDASAAQSVSVEVISIASVSTNQVSTVESDAAETLVSAGAEALPPTVPETIEAIEPETLEPPVEPEQSEPLPPDPVEPTQAKPVEPTEVDPVETATATLVTPAETVEVAEPERMDMAVLSAISPEPLEAEAVAPVTPTAAPAETATPVRPVQQPTLQPTEVTDLKVAPVPHVLTRPRPSEPTQRPRQQVTLAPPPRATPKAQPRPSAPAGNGGQNQADTVAARPAAAQQGNSGFGGDADVARYPSQVVSKLRRALRYPRGAGSASGEVHVQFTVSAGGQPSGVHIVKSSGNAAIDQAGIETVMRAAPFPPIPSGANRSSWGFTVPLAFERG